MLRISSETYAKNCVYNIIDKEKNAVTKKKRYRRKNRCWKNLWFDS